MRVKGPAGPSCVLAGRQAHGRVLVHQRVAKDFAQICETKSRNSASLGTHARARNKSPFSHRLVLVDCKPCRSCRRSVCKLDWGARAAFHAMLLKTNFISVETRTCCPMLSELNWS